MASTGSPSGSSESSKSSKSSKSSQSLSLVSGTVSTRKRAAADEISLQLDTEEQQMAAFSTDMLKEALTSVKTVVCTCAKMASAASDKGDTALMLQVVNSPGYLASLDALKEHMKLRNTQIKQACGIANANDDAACRPTDSHYDLYVTAKPDVTITDLELYIDAVEFLDIHAHDWFNVDTKSLRFEMMSLETAQEFDRHIKFGTLTDGRLVKDLFDSHISIRSAYSVKSVGLPKSSLISIPWLSKKLEVDFTKAKASLEKLNKFWFFNSFQLENIEVKSNRDKVWIQFFVARECFERFLRFPGQTRKIHLGGNGRSVNVWEQVKHDFCYNCLEVMHGEGRCTYDPRCRYCGCYHVSLGCKYSAAPECFRCRPPDTELSPVDETLTSDEEEVMDESDSNVDNPGTSKDPSSINNDQHLDSPKSPTPADQLGYAHDALSMKCPLVRKRSNLALQNQRALARENYFLNNGVKK